MTVSDLRPSSTVANTGAIVPSGTAHGVTSDDDDATYIDLGSAEMFTVALGNLTLPADAVIRDVTVLARIARSTAGTTSLQITAAIDPAGATPLTVFLSWGTPTDVEFSIFQAADPLTDDNIDNEELTFLAGGFASQILVYEVTLRVTYVEAPEVNVTAPSGTVTDTTIPLVEWDDTLDSDGGAQTLYQVRVFNAAQYGAGGFDPATSPATVETTATGAATSWQNQISLDDDDYRAYVRVAQTVNGATHWSDWDFAAFTVDVDRPGVPLLTLTDEPDDGRIRIDIDDQTGDATTDVLEIQRSTDGGQTWEPLRLTTDTAGVLDVDDEQPLYDIEAGNGQTVHYRARAGHDYNGVPYAWGDWASDDAAWTSRRWWLKSPQHPALNTVVNVDSQASYQRPARQGTFQALGATRAVVVSDTRGADRGTIAFRLDTDAQAVALDELLDHGGVLLLQGAPGEHWRDRYVVLGDLDRARLVDKAFIEGTVDTLAWTEVDPPAGPIDEWPLEAS